MRPIFCFIDDSAFEISVFEHSFPPADKGIEFITASTWAEAEKRIGDRYPCLFLLDLYGGDPSAPGTVPPLEELRETAAGIPSLEAAYEGLDQFDGDKVNEYLKRLFRTADGWRRLFYRASRQAGQSTAYGLGNLTEARRKFPLAAAAGYTRKSLIMDAVELWEARADGLYIKPPGGSDVEIYSETRLRAPELIERWSTLVDEKFAREINGLTSALARSGLADQADNLIQPDRLSPEANRVIGPDGLSFLKAAAAWQNHRTP